MEYRLNMRELLLGEPIRLRYTNRYSACRVNHRETVAEHSYYVVFYGLMIADWCVRTSVIEIDWRALAIRLAIHDLEESLTGDMPRSFKYSDEHLLATMRDAEKFAMVEICNKVVGGFEHRPGERTWASTLLYLWETAKDDTHEGRIVAFADFLSVMSFIVQEKRSGNRDAEEHIASIRAYFNNFKSRTGSKDPYAFLAPLIKEVGLIVEEFLE